MAKKKASKKERRRHQPVSLTLEEQAQVQMLLDRLAVQDPNGETFDQFLDSLRPLVQLSSDFTRAFVEALGGTATPTAVKVLQALQEIPAARPVRRALKTALYRLRRQGLIPEQEESEPVQRVLVPRPADRQAVAWASWPESGGERGVVLKVPDVGRGYVMAVSVLDSEGCFKELDAVQTTRKGVMDLLDGITGGLPGRLIEVPVSHFRFLFEEVAELHHQKKRELPSEYDIILKYLTSWADAPSGPHIYQLLDADEIAGDSLLLRSSGSILDLPPFTTWRLPEEVISSFSERIKAVSESRLVISQSTQLERIEQIVREASAELFTPELRQRYRRLLEEAALLLYLEDRREETKRVLAVAIDLGNEVGRLTENNFVLGLVKRSIGSKVDLEQDDAKESTTQEQTTESGLIIPR
ncbi:MAG: hypothetical protein JSU72_09235 [Deltaproteobacteria bacterium]|nr:MAG: hypothetical protein JSU72_09235 [Deltaproteobacteria bacterium]